MADFDQKLATFTRCFASLMFRPVAAAFLLASIILLMSMVVLAQEPATFTTLYRFSGGATGNSPQAALIRDTAGNLYGTTISGGTSNSFCSSGCGVVFKLDATGKETVLHAFGGGTDGNAPLSRLVADKAGNLYGTTYAGGNTECDGQGCGTIYKIDPSGNETILYSFKGGTGASQPVDGLIRDAKGNFYGTTIFGGAYNWGTVYKVDVTGTETVLYSFTGGTDGGIPASGVIPDGAGGAYGTTASGGSAAGYDGNGVVFHLDAKGHETVLHTFSGGTDGGYPYTGLIRDAAGNLYGTTVDGGLVNGACPFGCGVVYQVDPAGNETVLYTFTGLLDGKYPYSVLVRDRGGNLYGATEGGGTGTICHDKENCGVVFKVDRTGKETVLYDFHGGSDGGTPNGSLLGDASGDLYGTTPYYGKSGCGGSGCGTVFKVSAQ